MSTSSVLVEVVADPGAVREEVLDRDLVGDQRQVVAEQRAGGRRQREDAVLDQARDRQRRQPLDAARDRELRLERVRNLVSSMREPVRLGEDSVSPSRSTRTTPEKFVSRARETMARVSMRGGR